MKVNQVVDPLVPRHPQVFLRNVSAGQTAVIALEMIVDRDHDIVQIPRLHDRPQPEPLEQLEVRDRGLDVLL